MCIWITEVDRNKGIIKLKPKIYYTDPLVLGLSIYNKWVSKSGKMKETAVYDGNVVPEMQHILNNWEIIRDEANTAIRSQFTRSINKDSLFEGLSGPGWKRFYIKWYSDIDPIAKKLCPKTCKLIQSIPLIHSAMFSILEPGAEISYHR